MTCNSGMAKILRRREAACHDRLLMVGTPAGERLLIVITHRDLLALRSRISMPASIETFIRDRVPGARCIELCHDERQVVIRGGRAPIAAGCRQATGDRVILFESVACSARRCLDGGGPLRSLPTRQTASGRRICTTVRWVPDPRSTFVAFASRPSSV